MALGVAIATLNAICIIKHRFIIRGCYKAQRVLEISRGNESVTTDKICEFMTLTF